MLSFPLGESSQFSTSYKCFPVSFAPGNIRNDLEEGGKIIMPPSALDILTRQNIQYPMIFQLNNKAASRTTHCGVLEFVADEGNIYVPYWMLRNLLLEEGQRVCISSKSLPVASFAKFQPQTTDFLDITNPKAVLESALRKHACLTKGDIIAIQYNQKIYELKVLELKPADAVTIIECDMHVDFEAPVGYKDPSIPASSTSKNSAEKVVDDHIVIPEDTSKFRAFVGSGARLDGKTKKIPDASAANGKNSADTGSRQRGVPNYDYQPGVLTFFRNTKRGDANENPEDGFSPFGGSGNQLKPRAKQHG